MQVKIWTRDEIMLRLIQLQVGMSPPGGTTLDEAMKQFYAIAGENALRFERGAQFVWVEILALQRRIAELERHAEQLEQENERVTRQNEQLRGEERQLREALEKSDRGAFSQLMAASDNKAPAAHAAEQEGK